MTKEEARKLVESLTEEEKAKLYELLKAIKK